MVKKKKGVSPVIGYVLLISFGIIMSIIAYNYLKTYVPTEGVSCPDGSSVFVKDYACEAGMLNLTLKNNGKFNLEGYFIYGSNDSSVEIATIMLADKFLDYNTNPNSVNSSAQIIFEEKTKNYLVAQNEITHSFNVSNISNLAIIELIPTRIQEVRSRETLVTCGEARIREEISC